MSLGPAPHCVGGTASVSQQQGAPGQPRGSLCGQEAPATRAARRTWESGADRQPPHLVEKRGSPARSLTCARCQGEDLRCQPLPVAVTVMHKDGPALPPAHARSLSTLPHSVPPACKANSCFHPTSDDGEAQRGQEIAPGHTASMMEPRWAP